MNQTAHDWLTRLQDILGHEHFSKAMDAMQAPRDVGWHLHQNQALLALENDGISAKPGTTPDSFLTPATMRERLTHHVAVNQGQIYIQSLSSQWVAWQLGIEPGHLVLDLAAAPGGKTLLLAKQAGSTGRVSAVECSRPRYFKLKSVLARYGYHHVRTYHKDGRFLPPACQGRFDRILLDAPCSGESRFDPGEPLSWQHWRYKEVKRLARKQCQLLCAAVTYLKPGGLVLYATCTYAPEENEAVVNHALEHVPCLELQALPATIAALPGLTQWQNHHFHPSLVKSVRILPTTEHPGMFAALLKRTDR